MLAVFGMGFWEMIIIAAIGLLCVGFPAVMMIILVVWLNKTKEQGPDKKE